MSQPGIIIRSLRADDLEPVIALDQAYSGQSRRGFFDRRLQAAIDDPDGYIGLAADRDGEVDGFVLVHLLNGEFGGVAPVAVLDAMAVARDDRGYGVGSQLLDALLERVRHAGAQELQTQADWRQPDVLQFFARSGFSLAARSVLERSTDSFDF